MSARSDWDAIVIGSGLGGLTAAAYLTTNGLRTLVLEKHYVAGGNSHVFRRKGKFEFDVGVHYIGDCGPDGLIPTVLRGAGLDGKIEFLEMDPDGLDTLMFAGLTFRVPKGWDRYRERLVAAFPDDETGLHRYLDVLQGVLADLAKIKLPVEPTDVPKLMQEAPAFMRWGMHPLAELFDDCGLGGKARAVLAAESGTYATPPSRAPVLLHAALMDHYLKGAFYPRGGGQVIPAHLVDVVRSHRGEVRTRVPVHPILFYYRLSRRTVARVKQYRMALPIFCVYLGLDIDLRERLPNTNLWYFTSFDIEGMYRDCYEGRVPGDLGLFITAASLKDPHTEAIAPPGCTSLEVMMWAPPDHSFWGVEEGPAAGEKYHRNPKYQSLKRRLTDLVVDGAERVIPGIKEHIVWQEAATPVSQEHFTFSTGGSSYGIELAVDQFGPARPSPKTEIEGLYLAGASTVFAHGIAGTMRGGVGTASAVLGRDLWTEVSAGKVFGEPAKLTGGGPGWDPWEASR